MKYPTLLLPWLTLAAVADWLITRTLTRLAIFMPKPPPLLLIYQALNLVGQLAVTLVSLLGLAMLAWIAWREWQTRRAIWLPLVWLGLAGGSLTFLVIPPASWGVLLYHLVGLMAVALIASRALRRESRVIERSVALFLPMLAILAGKLYQTIPAFYAALRWPGPPPLTEALFNLGELLVVLSSIGLWWAFGRNASGRIWLAAALPALLFSTLYLLNPAMTGILAVWSTGLTLYLPWPLYGVSLWLAGVAVLAALRRGEPVGWAILLLAAGGYAPQLSIQEFLGLIALWLLAEPVRRSAVAPQTTSGPSNFQWVLSPKYDIRR